MKTAKQVMLAEDALRQALMRHNGYVMTSDDMNDIAGVMTTAARALDRMWDDAQGAAEMGKRNAARLKLQPSTYFWVKKPTTKGLVVHVPGKTDVYYRDMRNYAVTEEDCKYVEGVEPGDRVHLYEDEMGRIVQWK